ncbi:epoxide hydrolase 4 isoform X1 [Anser cygnoides]|uniref:epoxide hydrolase 4 isoform X1 n=1 Tax=Anser cygnoides TaxID=8845 RepID=UPI0034D29BB0
MGGEAAPRGLAPGGAAWQRRGRAGPLRPGRRRESGAALCPAAAAAAAAAAGRGPRGAAGRACRCRCWCLSSGGSWRRRRSQPLPGGGGGARWRDPALRARRPPAGCWRPPGRCSSGRWCTATAGCAPASPGCGCSGASAGGRARRSAGRCGRTLPPASTTPRWAPTATSGSRYSWRHQLREFKSEYRVVALDLRGYGETDAPSHKENYKLDCLITDIKDILESLGYNKCVLIGHDWGGMIAWLVAICYPEMVTKLIVVNFPHPSVFTEYILRHPSQLIKSAYYFFFQMPWFPEFMFTVNDFKVLKSLFTSQATGIGRKGCRLTAEDIEAYLYVFSQPGALTGPINHYRNIFSCLPLQHHEVIMPTLLLWGERDAFMEVDMAEITRIYVKNHFRLTILSEASHWLQQDQPDIVNKLIWTFLKEETTRKRE